MEVIRKFLGSNLQVRGNNAQTVLTAPVVKKKKNENISKKNCWLEKFLKSKLG